MVTKIDPTPFFTYNSTKKVIQYIIYTYKSHDVFITTAIQMVRKLGLTIQIKLTRWIYVLQIRHGRKSGF